MDVARVYFYALEMENLIYFGSPLAKYRLDLKHVDAMNTLADQILGKEVLPDNYNYQGKLASAVNKEYRLPMQMIPDTATEILLIAESYHKRFYVSRAPQKGKLKFHSSWVVSQYETEWNFLHSHTGLLSGIIYLKVPENMAHDLDKSDKRARLPGGISFVECTAGPYRIGSNEINPVVGDFYLFPADLMHTVYPFFGPGERRSMSFNLMIEGQIDPELK